MTKEDVQNIIINLAEKYKITLVSVEDNTKYNGDRRNMMYACGDEISLNTFDDPDIELLTFFHELGHVIDYRKHKEIKRWHLCMISKEAIAWEIGLDIAAKEGFIWDYKSKQYNYARDCLKSYIESDIDPLGGFN